MRHVRLSTVADYWRAILGSAVLLGLSVAAVVVRLPWDAWGTLGYVGLFIASIVTAALLVVSGPGQALIVSAGATLNPLLVGIVAGAGLSVGELTGYILGRNLPGVSLARLPRGVQVVVARGHASSVLFALAAIPNPFFDLTALYVGNLRIGFWRFYLPTLAGKVVRGVILALVGWKLLN